jgi:hypothetical protein
MDGRQWANAVLPFGGLFLVILRLDLTRVQEVVKHGVRFVFEAGAECIAPPVQVAPERLGVYDEGDGESDDAEDDGSNPGDIPEHRHIPAHFTTLPLPAHPVLDATPTILRACRGLPLVREVA